MPVPQVTERLKEAPAAALRALFAGIGQLLLAVDKVRSTVVEQMPRPPQPAKPPEPAARPPQPTTPPQRPLRETSNVRVIREGPPVAEPTGPAEAVPAPAPTAPPAPAPAVPAAPIPNYDELSIASLRARLRGLDATAVRALLDYERAHVGRETVIAMYERRLEKIEGAAG